MIDGLPPLQLHAYACVHANDGDVHVAIHANSPGPTQVFLRPCTNPEACACLGVAVRVQVGGKNRD